MRGFVPSYQLQSPSSLSEALSLLAQEPNKWKPFAGGTDLMVQLEMGNLTHRNFLSLHGLSELRHITESDRVLVGTTTTFAQLQKHTLIRSYFPMLAEASESVGAIAIQNRATLGGNIMNASPAADSSPALLAYDADVELVSSTGSRWIPYKDFHTGYKKTHLKPEELLLTIALKKPHSEANRKSYFRKVGTRQAQSISKLSMAAWVELSPDKTILDCRVAMGSIAGTPIRCYQTETALKGHPLDFKTIGESKEALFQEIHPIDDIRSNAEYRLRVSLNLLEDFLIRYV